MFGVLSPRKLIYAATTCPCPPHACTFFLFMCAGYTAGWLAHLNTWSVVGLHSEQGIDRMARPALGFHGTVLARVLVCGSGELKPPSPDKLSRTSRIRVICRMAAATRTGAPETGRLSRSMALRASGE